MDSKVSIILPTYNREKYIKEAIDSVVKQSYENWELIIIDDGSKDRTKDIVRSYQKDLRIKYFYQENTGEYPATNLGFSKVSGDYVSILHSDDYLPLKSLELRVKELDSNPDIDVVHGDMTKVDSAGKFLEKLIATNDDNKTILKHYCIDEDVRTKLKYYVHFQTFMVRKRCLSVTGVFDPNLKFGGDLDWMMRVIRDCTMKRIPEVLHTYRRHTGAISQENKRDKLPIKDITRDIQLRYCREITK